MIIQLFYSTKCKACNELMMVIVNEGMQRMFMPVCLDEMSPKNIAELKLERIPAIVIITDNQTPMIFEGSKNCGEWLNNIIRNRRVNMKQYVNNQRKLVQQSQTVACTKEQETLEYINEEMDGVSDAYAYVATDIFQPKNFVPVGQEHHFSVVTPQDKEDKLSNIDTTNKLKEVVRTRDFDTCELQKQMEKQQIQTIINSQFNAKLS